MDQSDVDKAILKYEKFINDVLRVDLQKLHHTLQVVNAELADLIQQKHALKIITDKDMHPNGFKTQLDIGCNFFMEASVTDTSKMLLDIGLNHYLELSLDEVNKYLDVRINVLEKRIEEIQLKAAETKGHIKFILLSIGDLQYESSKKES